MADDLREAVLPPRPSRADVEAFWRALVEVKQLLMRPDPRDTAWRRAVDTVDGRIEAMEEYR